MMPVLVTNFADDFSGFTSSGVFRSMSSKCNELHVV